MTKVSGDRSKLPLNLRRRESAQKAAASAEAEKEKAFANMEEASDKQELVDTEEYKYFRDYVFYQEERGSPLRVLVDQRNGYSYSGFYHTGIRDDPIPSFKCQHMIFRAQADAHPQQKYSLKEEHMYQYMCQMTPIYERRPNRHQVIFRSGDIRSTLKDALMEKASAIKETALEAQDALSERVKELSDSGNPDTREELMYAMLHYFLADSQPALMKMRSETYHWIRYRIHSFTGSDWPKTHPCQSTRASPSTPL